MLLSFARNIEQRTKEAQPTYVECAMTSASVYGPSLLRAATSIVLQMRRTGTMWKSTEEGKLPEWFGSECASKYALRPLFATTGNKLVTACLDANLTAAPKSPSIQFIKSALKSVA